VQVEYRDEGCKKAPKLLPAHENRERAYKHGINASALERATDADTEGFLPQPTSAVWEPVRLAAK
jgi:hypothetical protein